MEGAVEILNGSLESQLGDQVDGDPLGTTRSVAEHPEAVVKAYQEYLSAGCSVLTTCTYQGSIKAIHEELAVTVQEAEEIIVRSVTLARQAILRNSREDQLNSNNPRGGRVLIAGSVGCYGAYLYDGSEYHGRYAANMSEEQLRDWHRPRVQCLVEAGCDLLAFETIPVQKEAMALLQLLREFPNTRAWLSFCCPNNLDIASQEPFAKAVATCMARDSQCQLSAIGVNCCPPGAVAPLLQSTSAGGAALRVPTVVYPDRSTPYSKPEEKDEDPFGKYVQDWYKAGARVMGGCCQTTPSHIAAMATAIASFV